MNLVMLIQSSTHKALFLCNNRLHLLILRKDIWQRTNGRDAELINLLMALRIMELNMLELSRLPEGRHVPVQPAHPAMNSGIPGANIPDITLEMLDIHRVEADDGGEQPDISLGDGGAEEERCLGRGCGCGEVGFDAVEGGEEGRDGLAVGLLGSCEAGLVDAVVDVVVDPVVGVFDLLAERGREWVDLLVFLGEEVVEFMIEHADDFGALLSGALVRDP